jgi:hypothetical protein
MPYKTSFPPLPYLDPEFNPDHPLNQPIKIKDDPHLPYGKRQLRRMEKEARAEALAKWQPPHVPRSYDTDPDRAETRREVLSLTLSPRPPLDFRPRPSDYRYLSDDSPNLLPGSLDFRRFAYERLHLGPHRIHASHNEPHLPSEELDPALPPEEYCWILEYTYNEANTIRRRLAHFMGLYPAVTDPDNPFYSEELAWRYDRRLYCRCRRRNRLCIRPSHIEIFTSTLDLLP